MISIVNAFSELMVIWDMRGRALGHRVWQSIENYMANHPDVISAFTAEKVDIAVCDKCMQRAFEEALVHKVMPKLRGIDSRALR